MTRLSSSPITIGRNIEAASKNRPQSIPENKKYIINAKLIIKSEHKK